MSRLMTHVRKPRTAYETVRRRLSGIRNGTEALEASAAAAAAAAAYFVEEPSLYGGRAMDIKGSTRDC